MCGNRARKVFNSDMSCPRNITIAREIVMKISWKDSINIVLIFVFTSAIILQIFTGIRNCPGVLVVWSVKCYVMYVLWCFFS